MHSIRIHVRGAVLLVLGLAIAGPATAQSEQTRRPPRPGADRNGTTSRPADDSTRNRPDPTRKVQDRQTVPPVVRPAVARQMATEIVPPSLAASPPPGAVLRPDSFSQMLSGFKGVRSLPIESIRVSPVMALGNDKLNFRPLLDSKGALPNIAERLRSQPQVATILGEKSDIVEIDRGILVRNFLSYRLKPGVCSDPRRRSLARTAGAQCAGRIDDAVRAKAMADPDDTHYIADSKKRSALLFKASIDSAKQMEAVSKYLPQLRAALAGSEGATMFGAAEATRLAGLGDDQLLDEIASTAIVTTEEFVFIPSVQPLDIKFLSGIDPSAYKTTFADWGKKAQIKPITGHHELSTQYFLTGFTTGRAYEWRKRAEVTIDWCIVGCSETYYAEVYANFGYAFGLRFPIEMTGSYDFHDNMAFVTPRFKPVDGKEKTYQDAGLPADQVHGGKEFVAEVSFGAGLNYKIPILGADGIGVSKTLDFTDYLEKPFAGGQVLPPAPGESSPPMVKVIDQIDLLGGRADLGIAGARVHPIVEVTLQSSDLHFTLHDDGNGKPFDTQAKSGELKRLTYDPVTKVSKFSLGDPVYALDFLITPGIRPKLFVDVGVWSYDWHADLTFPQYALKLPPGGAIFSCHTKTVCARNYEFSPDAAKETQGVVAAQDNRFSPSELAPNHWYWGKVATDIRPGWAYAFDDKFFPQCPAKDKNKECEGKLKSIRFDTLLQMGVAPVASQEKYKNQKPSAFITQAVINSMIATDLDKRLKVITDKADKDAAYAMKIYAERYK